MTLLTLIRVLFMGGLAVFLLVPKEWAEVGRVVAGVCAAILAFLIITGKF